MPLAKEVYLPTKRLTFDLLFLLHSRRKYRISDISHCLLCDVCALLFTLAFLLSGKCKNVINWANQLQGSPYSKVSLNNSELLPKTVQPIKLTMSAHKK